MEALASTCYIPEFIQKTVSLEAWMLHCQGQCCLALIVKRSANVEKVVLYIHQIGRILQKLKFLVKKKTHLQDLQQ